MVIPLNTFVNVIFDVWVCGGISSNRPALSPSCIGVDRVAAEAVYRAAAWLQIASTKQARVFEGSSGLGAANGHHASSDSWIITLLLVPHGLSRSSNTRTHLLVRPDSSCGLSTPNETVLVGRR